MKFLMNDREWTIKEVEQEEFWKDEGEEEKIGSKEYHTNYHFGRCIFSTREIWLWKDVSEEQKRKTLYHELMHCYRGMYIGFYDIDGQDEDMWCEISANSHDIIHKIVEDYFKPRINIQWKVNQKPNIALLDKKDIDRS